ANVGTLALDPTLARGTLALWHSAWESRPVPLRVLAHSGSAARLPRQAPLVPRAFVSGAAAQYLMRTAADLGRHRSHARIGGHQDTRFLTQRFHHPATLAHHFVLLSTDRRQRIGV